MPEDILQIWKADITDLQKKAKVSADRLDDIEKKGKKATKGLKKGFTDADKSLQKFGARLLGAFAIQQVIGSAISTIREFEKELSTLQSITGQSKDEMKFFAEEAIRTGSALNQSSKEVVKAFTLVGSARPELLKNKEALVEVTKQSLILAKAAGIDTVQAANALTNAMNQFGASTEDAAMFTDILATSQQKGSSFIVDTAEAMKNAGSASRAAGLSFQDANVAIQALAKGGIKGAEAGTKLRGVLSILASQNDDSINPSIVGLQQSMEGLKDKNLDLAEATKIFGRENATAALTLVDQIDIIRTMSGTLNETGNALAQAAVNVNNFDGEMEGVGIAFENFVLSLNKGDGAISKVLSGMARAARTTLEWLSAQDKLSDSLVTQQIELNALVGQVTDTNIKEDERLRLINDLNSQYPEFLKNLNAETVTNEELAKRLKDVNESLVNKIIIQRKQEALDEVAGNLAEARIEKAEAELHLRRNLAEIAIKQGKQDEIQNKTLDEQLKLLGFNNKALSLSGKSLLDQSFAIQGIVVAYRDYQSALKDVSEGSEALKGVEEEKRAVLEALGISQDELNEKTKEGVDAAEDLTEAETLLTNSIKFLKTEKSKLRTELDLLSIGSSEFIRVQNELTAITNELAIAQGQETEAMKKAREEREKAAAAEENARNKRLKGILEQALAELEFGEKVLFNAQSLTDQENELFKERLRNAGIFGKSREELTENDLAVLLALEETHAEKLAAIDEDLAAKKKKLGEQEIEDQKQQNQEMLDAIVSTAQTFVMIFDELSQRKLDKELATLETGERNQLDSIQKQVDQELITREEGEKLRDNVTEAFQKKRAEVLTKQAKKDKAAALFSAVIFGVAAVVKQGVITPLGIATAIANAAQIALIASQPIPEFAKGVVDYKGQGTETSDSNLVKISKRESIITANATKAYGGELEAANSMRLERFIQDKYVTPAIQDAVQQIESNKQSGMADNIAGSLNLLAKMDPSALHHISRSNRNASNNNARVIVEGLTRSNKDLAHAMNVDNRRKM